MDTTDRGILSMAPRTSSHCTNFVEEFEFILWHFGTSTKGILNDTPCKNICTLALIQGSTTIPNHIDGFGKFRVQIIGEINNSGIRNQNFTIILDLISVCP